MKNISKNKSDKKQTAILWISAIILTYVFGYVHSVIDPNFPISGTIGIRGEKVTYKFDKIATNTGDYEIFIRTDLSGLTGFVEYRDDLKKREWKKSEFIALVSGYKAKLEALPFNQSYQYKVFLYDGENEIQIPANSLLKIKFIGEVPITISIFFYILLFGGMIFTVRVGIEYFSGRNNHKKLLLSSVIFYFLFTFVAAPLTRLFEAGVYGSSSASLSEIFLFKDLFYFVFTCVGFLAIFNSRKSKLVGLIYSLCMIGFYIIFYH